MSTESKTGAKYIDKDPPMEQSGNLPRRILDYLAYLKETLNFIFNNYGRRLVNADGDINELTRTAEETTSRLSDAEGNISTLQQTAEGLESRVEDAEGDISTLQQTAQGLTYEVFDAGSTLNTNISAVAGKVAIVIDSNDNIKAAEIVAAVNDAGSSVIISADHLDLNGYVTFTNLSTSGQTAIDGANITTGYISADRINAGTITLSKLGSDAKTAISNAASAASDAQTAANGANSQEQLVYISKAAGTTSVTAPTAWVTNNNGAQNTWGIKRPVYDSSYPVLFVATQRKTVGGTVTCTTPLIDATTTVIDGGNIITGTVTANQIAGGTITSTQLANSVNESISGAASAASTAQTTANGANAREQLIYISKASGTSSVSANTTWVTNADGTQNKWGTKRPVYNSSYPVLFVAMQRQTVAQMANSGTTCSCTTPVKDDTTTVIDGGHITTGTIDASVATITNINASNITSGTIAAARIASGSLAIGKLDTDAQNTINAASTNAAAALQRGVEYIVGTQTASTNAWTGVTTDSAIYAGKTIAYYLPYAGTSSAATLNLTLSGGGTTGAKNVRINNSNVTTHYPAGTIINLTFDGTYWKADNYDSNNYDRTRYNSNVYALAAITAGHLMAGTASGYKMLAASLAFDLSYPILYAGSAIEASANGSNNYTMMSNINFSTTGTIQGGAAKKILYLKGSVSGTTFTIAASNWLTTTVPTSEDSMYYIPLGVMSSATNGSFLSSNQLWGYVSGSFQIIGTGAVALANAAQTTANTANGRAVAYRGVCSTAATTAAKTVTCANFALVQGASVTVYNTTAQTKADAAITLNVNGTGAKTIYVAGAATSSTNQILWTANSTVTFTYDGTYWRIQDNPGVWYGSTCSVAAATAAKTTTVNEAVLYKGSMVYVPMTYANTSTSATLNVSSTGAKAVYYDTGTTRPTTSNGHGWIAGKSAAFVFDGAYWRISEGATYVDGGNIMTGTVLASSIKANETFTQNLTATNFNITGGSVNIQTSASGTNIINLTSATSSSSSAASFSHYSSPGVHGISCETGASSSSYLYKSETHSNQYGYFGTANSRSSASAAYTETNGFSLSTSLGGLEITTSSVRRVYLTDSGLTFYDSSGTQTAKYLAAGPTLTTSSATAVSVAHQTYKSVGSVSLAAGTWLVKATIAFAANATGTRYVVPSYTANSSSAAVDWSAEALCPAVPRSGFKTDVQTTFIVKHTETKTIYFNAWQDSGSALSAQLLYQTLKLA